MQNLLERLESVLRGDERLVVDGKLAKNRVVELALAMDEGLLALLLADEVIRGHFFRDVGGVSVFDKREFHRFVNNRQFLPDSYTAFKNKIGLAVDEEYLTAGKEVVLVWPYKDCVLEGGQTKEEQKRNEIFWNETLAPDDVDRLLAPKVFTNFRRYDRDGEHSVADIGAKDNLLIKGNNLLALYSLKKAYAGKVKLIYIDPPYNTGSDSFGYNDSFNHSTWLTFMKNRLEVARELLRDDGVIFVHCDDNEAAYLKVLMDEVFGRENFIESITVINNPSGRDYGGVANMHEFLHIFSKTPDYELYPIKERDKSFPYRDEFGGFEIRELRNRNVKFNDKNRPNLVYPFYLNPSSQDEDGFFEISLEKRAGFVEILPAKSQGIQTVWRWGKEKASQNLNTNICGKAMKENGRYQIVEKYRSDSRIVRSVWTDAKVSSQRGTLHLKKLFNNKAFDNPKPEETLNRVIEMASVEGDLVLDFFAGSGTTAAVAHKMNRRWIAVEQMDYVETVTAERLKKVIAGEQGGVSKDVGWQGGGDFIYCELARHSAALIDRIERADTPASLQALWREMERTDVIHYQTRPEDINENIHEFSVLSLEEQRQFLIEVLDKNQLYVNYSEIDDDNHRISGEDRRLNRQFYGDEAGLEV